MPWAESFTISGAWGYDAVIGRTSKRPTLLQGTETLVEALRTWLIWATLAALAPGWAAWLITRDETGAYLTENRLEGASPADAWPYLVTSITLMVVVIVAMARIQRRLHPELSAHEVLGRVSRWLRPLLALPILPLLFEIETGIASLLRPTLIALVALFVATGVHAWRWPTMWRRPTISSTMVRTLSMGTVAVATLVWVVFFTRLGWMRHWSLNTRAFDLGIYDNLFWNTIHGDPLACSLIKGGVHTSAHFDPFLVLLAPLYALSPRAETLISIQAVWLATGVIPLYLLAMRQLGSRSFATVVCLCYLLYPSLQGIALFDFHSLALLIPLGIWAVERLEAGSTRGYFVALACILMVREDAALFACGLGLWAMVRRPARVRVGLATLFMCLGWLAFVKLLVMPDAGLLMANSDETYTYANRYEDVIPGGEGGVTDIVATLLTNPMFVLQYVLQYEKVVSVVVLLLPLCFLPLLGGAVRVTFVYGFTFTLLASKPSIYYPYFHYVAVLVPVLFAAVPAGVKRFLEMARTESVSTPLGRATMVALIASSTLCAIEYAAIVENDTFRLHTDVPRELTTEDRERLAWLRGAAAQIPVEATVSASNRLAPHVTNRRGVHIVQQGVDTDYLLVHKGDLTHAEREDMQSKIRRGTHTIIDTHGLLVLVRRNSP